MLVYWRPIKLILLSDTPTSSMDHTDVQRHLAVAAAFPHFLPQVLPTSVAITNPSLNPSDLLALRLRETSYAESRLREANMAERGFADSRIPSPQDLQSRGSPMSPSDSPFMYDRSSLNMSADLMDASGNPGHLISFCSQSR